MWSSSSTISTSRGDCIVLLHDGQPDPVNMVVLAVVVAAESAPVRIDDRRRRALAEITLVVILGSREQALGLGEWLVMDRELDVCAVAAELQLDRRVWGRAAEGVVAEIAQRGEQELAVGADLRVGRDRHMYLQGRLERGELVGELGDEGGDSQRVQVNVQAARARTRDDLEVADQAIDALALTCDRGERALVAGRGG